MNKTASLALRSLLGSLLVLVSLLAAGCGGSDGKLAPVKGTVTLDGEPLAEARVEFDPDPGEVVRGKSTGSASYGKTDSSGRYTLQYTHEKQGALVGKHTVRITTRGMTVDPDGKEVLVPERLPPKYHLNSELTAEVKPGSNTFDFPLSLESSSGGQQ
ncbi:MAG TPA: carboxypeptidase-like regulatory domain-containing protein [Thermoguttaceae bacterium]|nr:carboxypeptidase-like regulatory domain-containing protein [Thermoguttaceae bacterium]